MVRNHKNASLIVRSPLVMSFPLEQELYDEVATYFIYKWKNKKNENWIEELMIEGKITCYKNDMILSPSYILNEI